LIEKKSAGFLNKSEVQLTFETYDKNPAHRNLSISSYLIVKISVILINKSVFCIGLVTVFENLSIDYCRNDLYTKKNFITQMQFSFKEGK